MDRTRLRTALVTGAARRIGRAIVEDLAHQGFAVAIHAHESIEEAEALAQHLRAEGARAVAVQADLADVAACGGLLKKTTEMLGPVDLLVNNASIFKYDSAEAFENAIWDEHFDVHVRAPAILSAAFARQLPEDVQGLIVNIIDQRVLKPNPRFFSYTLSKSALWTATKTMAQALAPRIRVNAIGPGPTVPSSRQSIADFQAQVDRTILKVGPRFDEFGRTIRFLFDTPSITGQMIALDGGQHLGWQTPDIMEIVE
ncbi:SDR family oxidoreductase [Rhizobiaceae bacterium n13]|uniref:SDR family oxidoreductase n=1 Tax=Ferirhizobium litorale TaxID=2927786 RepID=A0AAE3QC67_9HYPH|nr:SDR family oxidoreductase [Fererhizobium litorale]MDI7861063.1 SDR family oxidoreductase [Fererhizobium litorale]MDI7921210.1 SDR family oxidoreductase [Fererhizobium litorale]